MIVKETGQIIEGDKIHHLTKRHIDWNLFDKRKCIDCYSNIVAKDSTSIKQRDDIIIVRCDLDYKDYRAVRCKKCIPKLNSNSFEYNMKKYGLTENEAKELIYSRNKSPFYKSNHDNYESYRKFQAHDDFSEERKEHIQRKQNKGRARWQKKFIEENGYDAFRNLKDSSSKKHFKELYGDEWLYYYDEKCEKNKKKNSSGNFRR